MDDKSKVKKEIDGALGPPPRKGGLKFAPKVPQKKPAKVVPKKEPVEESKEEAVDKELLMKLKMSQNKYPSARIKSEDKRDRSGIKKRYSYHTKEIMSGHPELIDRALPSSLTTRFSIIADAVPKLAQEAASRAIADWGRPAAHITHLVVATNSGANEPGADLRLAELLGLRPTVRRTLLYLHGCSAGIRAASSAAGGGGDTHGHGIGKVSSSSDERNDTMRDGLFTGGLLGFNLQKERLRKDEWEGLIANL